MDGLVNQLQLLEVAQPVPLAQNFQGKQVYDTLPVRSGTAAILLLRLCSANSPRKQ
jgi:hypothetical protein